MDALTSGVRGQGPEGTPVPQSVQALRAFWRKHQQKLYAVPAGLYDGLDALIRADERRVCLEELGMVGLAHAHDTLVGENARLTDRLAAHHILGGCPHCRHPHPPRPVPMAAVVGVGAVAGVLLGTVGAVLVHAAAAGWAP